MTEHPILFDGESVRAILAGHKWQTRRVVKPQPQYVWGFGVALNSNEFTAHVRYPGGHQPDPWVRCPYGAPPHRGQPGDRLWVREGLQLGSGGAWKYVADQSNVLVAQDYSAAAAAWAHHKTRSYCAAIHMPRWAARILLTVTDVRVERLQAISEADAEAEGVDVMPGAPAALDHRTSYARRWNAINGKRASWASDPWVWVISFEVV